MPPADPTKGVLPEAEVTRFCGEFHSSFSSLPDLVRRIAARAAELAREEDARIADQVAASWSIHHSLGPIVAHECAALIRKGGSDGR